jgi:nitroreductase
MGEEDATSMPLLEALETTRSVRRFHLDEDMPDSVLTGILRMATRAPNPGNLQKWRFLVLRPNAVAAREMLGDAYRDGWREQRISYGYHKLPEGEDSPKARIGRTMQVFVDNFERIPVLILACVSGVTPDAYLGGAPAIFPACQNLLLAARAYGYGGVLTTWHRRIEAELRELLAVPDDVLIAATIPLGRPVGHFGPMRRRPLEQAIFDGTWGATASWIPSGGPA